MTTNLQGIALVTGIIIVCFGALFYSLRSLLNSGIADMKSTIKKEIEIFNAHCVLVSGNLHSSLASETKQRIYADEKIEKILINHGHKGLDDAGSKVTI